MFCIVAPEKASQIFTIPTRNDDRMMMSFAPFIRAIMKINLIFYISTPLFQALFDYLPKL